MAEGYRIWLDRISTSYGTQPKAKKDTESNLEVGIIYGAGHIFWSVRGLGIDGRKAA